MKQPDDGSLSIRLFGRFEVYHDDTAISVQEWGRRKTQALLKLLLTLPGRVFAQDQLIDALFTNLAPDKALKNLYSRVSELRHVLEPKLQKGGKSSFIQRVGQGYRFAVEGECWIDVQEFEGHEQEARAAVEAGRWMNASEACRSALDLYRGEFLAEDRYEEWSIAPREEWRNRYLAVLEHMAHCQSQLGLYKEAVRYCRQVIAVQPYREATYRDLMRYHYQSGESGAVLKDYQACLQALREHLDVGPAPETVALRESIARHELPHGEEAPDPLRVAVLPLANFGPDLNDEYFADGMTEEMIAQLSKIDGLQIIARTSIMQYKGTHKGIAQIGRELRVGTVLEGSVRKSGSRLRIAMQLINVNGEVHLWSDEYDRELKDAVAIQCDVARQIASSLVGRLLLNVARAFNNKMGRDPVAYELYLKGRFFWNKWTKDGYDKAIKYYKQALAVDPGYALVYAGLADVHNLMAAEGMLPADEAYTTAKGYAARAIEIDDTLAEAHASLAFIAWKHERDLDRAEQEFRRAIMLNPNYPTAHAWYAQLLEVVGRIPEALAQSQEALALDPLSANLTFQVGMALAASRRLDEAIDMLYKTLELNPAFTSARLQLSAILRSNNEWKRGIAEARRVVELEPENPYAHQFLSMALIAFGRRDEGLVQLDEALRLCLGCETTSMLFNAGVGCYFAREYDRAITYLGQASERDPVRTDMYVMLAAAHIEKGEYTDALNALEKAESIFGGVDDFWSVWIPARRGQVYALQGNTKKAEEELKVLLEKTELRNRRVAVSALLLALGRMDEAFEWADRAIDANEPHILPIKCSPMWEKCSSDPRYHALLRKMGLEE